MSRIPIEFRRRVEQLLLEHDVDIKRLWKTLPQIPDPEMGLPFAGPLDPVPFCYPPCGVSSGTVNTGGTPSSATHGGCPGTFQYNVKYTITGVGCVHAGTTNAFLSFTSHIGAVCRWDGVAGRLLLYNTTTGLFQFQDAGPGVTAQDTILPPPTGSGVNLPITIGPPAPCVLPAFVTVIGV